MNEAWMELTLGEVCTLITDGAHHSPKSVETGLPMASVKDLTPYGINLDTCRKISEEDFDSLVGYGCQPEIGDVLIAKDGNSALDTVCLVKRHEEVVLLSSVAILRPDPKQVTTSFLHYYLDSDTTRRYLKSGFITGAAIPRVILQDFKRARISVPPLEIQQKIAAVLSAYDDLIENNTRRIAILEEMAQLIYREWFVHFRFPGHEEVEMVEVEGFGEIPSGWKLPHLEELYHTSSGGTPSRKRPEYYRGTIPWVKSKELDDRYLISTEEKITYHGLRRSSAKIFPENTVIMAMYGATIGQLGILSFPAATNQACCAIMQKHEPFGYAFAFSWLKANRDYVLRFRMGAAQQNISQKIIKKFIMVQPPEDIVIAFNEFVDPILERLRLLQQQNLRLKQMRDLLLPQLISGVLDASKLKIADP